MSLFGTKTERIAVIDVRSSSIGAAYVALKKDTPPSVVYTVRVPIEPHATEPLSEAVPRAIEKALSQLVKEGSPLMHTAVGSASVSKVFVTFTAPWQKSTVFSRVIEKDKPFTFTHQTIAESNRESGQEDEPGMKRVSEQVIATVLNGYEVPNPFGKKIKRAELIMLSSALDKTLMETVAVAVRKALHQHHIEFNAFLPEAYAVFRDLYPHQRDFLVLDIGNEASDVLLAKHGLLIALDGMKHGVAEMGRIARAVGFSSPAVPHDASVNVVNTDRNADFSAKVQSAETAWLAEVRASLGALAKQEPLSRTVFLIAEENVKDFLRHLLDAPELRALWLSDEPITILPVLAGQFAPFLAEGSVQPADPVLAILALASNKSFEG